MMFGKTNSDLLVPVSAPTATGLPSTLADGTDNGSKFYTYSTGTKACAFIGILNQVNGLKLFNIDGSLMASVSTVA